MRVLFDHQAFSMQQYGGVSRYFAELMAQFETRREIETILTVKYSNNAYLDSYRDQGKIKSFFPKTHFRGKKVLLDHVNRNSSNKAIKEGSFDILHPTFYHPVATRIRGSKPLVVTVHDMIHEILPDYFDRYDPSARNKRAIAEQADRIIAVSENTRRDLIQCYQIPEEKIAVIHHGFNTLAEESFQSVDIPGNYLLYVGTRSRYKNFLFFLEAISSVLLKEKVHLVCAGGGGFNAGELKEINRLGISDLVAQFEITGGHLSYLYRNALAFVFPSLYEGFGMPILEAFSASCPVLLSNTSSFPEVAGDAAGYFDPRDAHSINDAVMGVLSDANFRTRLKQSGKQRLEEFSWKKAADETIAVYQQMV